jgi:hypothetical protein
MVKHIRLIGTVGISRRQPIDPIGIKTPCPDPLLKILKGRAIVGIAIQAIATAMA